MADYSGPAFPTINKQVTGHDAEGRPIYIEDVYFGLTKREYIAIEAMKAILTATVDIKIDDYNEDGLAEISFEVADAMLKRMT